MATIRELRALFTAEAKGINKAFQSIQQQSSRLGPATRRTTDEVNRNYESVVQRVNELQRVMEDADGADSFDELNQAAERTQREMSETGEVSREAMEELERAVQSGSRRLEGLGDDARSSFSEVERAVQDASEEIEDLGSGGLDELSESADGANESLSRIGGSGGSIMGIVAAGGLLGPVAAGIAAVGAGLIGAVAAGDKLQGSLNALQAQTGASAEEMETMEASMRNIYGGNYGESFDDIAQSMAAVKQNTNLSGAALENLTTDAIILRDTFEYDVNESVRAASSLMKNFGLEGEAAYELIAEGSQNGLNYADDLLDTINEYSVYYKQAGFSAEEMFNMFKNAQETGAFNLDYAADAFKEFGIIMTEDSTRASDALNNIGLNGEQLRKEFAQGGETARAAFQTIATELGTIEDPVERNIAGVELFGTKFEDLGADAVIQMSKTSDAITGTKGVMESIDAVRYDTIGETITGLGRSFVTGVLLPIQDRVMPGINKFADVIFTAAGALREFLSGNESASDILESYGLDPDDFQALLTAINTMQEVLSRLRETALPILKSIGTAIKDALLDAWPAIQSAILTAATTFGNAISQMRTFWDNNGEGITASLKEIGSTIKSVFVDYWPTVRAALSAIVGFIASQVSKIAEFWDENGAQIMAAVSKAFNFIKSVIDFVMPAVLFVIKTIWGNIKGVISGALDVIMGLVKTFSGLFTGDFSKMWEGIKQVFSGAIEFVWNYLQLMFIGRILKAAGAFYAAFRGGVTALWTAIKAAFAGNISAVLSNARAGFTAIWTTIRGIFTNLMNFISATWNSVKSITSGAINFVKNLFTTGFQTMFRTASSGLSNILTKFRNIFTSIRDFVSGRFGDIVDAAKALPGRIGTGIGNMASKVKSGVTSVINTLARTLGRGVNGVIGGINWVLGKIGVDTEIPEWDVPQYAQGTKAHPGGLAMVNDGRGSNAGPELIVPKKGSPYMLEGTDVVAPIEKGAQVLSAKNTQKALSGIPNYDSGLGTLNDIYNGVKGAGKAVMNKVTDYGRQVIKKTVNVFDYLKNPGKLLDVGLSSLGIKKPSGSGFISDMAVGAWNKVKDGAVGYVKDKLKGFTEQAGPANFGNAFRKTSSFGWRIHPITGARTFHNGDDYGAAVGTPIPSQSAGQVIQSGFQAQRGNYVRVRNGQIEYIYQHNTRNAVGVGDMVQKGQTVGYVGSTGRSTGPHLHYEVWKNGAPIRPNSLAGATLGAANPEGAFGGAGLSAEQKYFEFIRSEGDWLNDFSQDVPASRKKSLLVEGYNLTKALGMDVGKYGNYWLKKLTGVDGYADGGIVGQKQLAWLAEGGFAESVISHDPSKKTSQRAIWEETGRQLGFDLQGQLNKQMLDVLQRIADGVESERDIQMVMSDRIVGQLVEKHVTEQKRLQDKRSRDFKGATR